MSDQAVPQPVEHSAWNISTWSMTEIKYLRGHAHEGALAISQRLNILRAQEVEPRPPLSERAVRQQAHRMRVAVRRRGCRRGLVIGQPRGESWARSNPTLRDKILDGSLNMTLAELRIAADVAGVELCPECGVRPQRHRQTGLCGVCHRAHLTSQLREQAAEAAANREYQAVKQQNHRTKTCTHPGCDHTANGTGGLCYSHARMKRQGLL